MPCTTRVGCADVREDLPCVVPVVGRQVAPLGMRGHCGVAECPVRPGVRCRPARRVHQLEQGPPRRPGLRPHQRSAHLVGPFNGVRAAGRCAPEDEGAHAVRVPGCGVLGQASAHGCPVHIGPADGESVEHRDHVQGEQLGAVGDIGLVACPGTAVVERDGAAFTVEVVAHRVPPTVVVRLPRQQDQRRRPFALDLIGDTDPVGRHRARPANLTPHGYGSGPDVSRRRDVGRVHLGTGRGVGEAPAALVEEARLGDGEEGVGGEQSEPEGSQPALG